MTQVKILEVIKSKSGADLNIIMSSLGVDGCREKHLIQKQIRHLREKRLIYSHDVKNGFVIYKARGENGKY